MTDGNFDCDEEGIRLQAMDNSHVALVSVKLNSDGFNDYRCDRPLTLGVNIASLTKVIKCAKDDDEVVLSANDGADLLNLVYNAKGERPFWRREEKRGGWGGEGRESRQGIHVSHSLRSHRGVSDQVDGH